MIEKKPVYYDSFHCIADQCHLTCCQEWKIAVDDATQEKWNTVKPPLDLMKEKGGQMIVHETLSQYTTIKDEARVIKLDTEKKCPFLNRKKLCNLVIQYGDDILSETCAIFPRQMNTFVERDVKEYSLVACCPAVIDLLKEQKKFDIMTDQMTEMEKNHTTNISGRKKELHGYEAYEETLSEIRDHLIQIVQNPEVTVSEAMMSGFFMLLSLLETEEKERKKKASAEKISSTLGKVLEVYDTETETRKILSTIRQMKFETLDTFEERNELFLDLAENYRKEGIYEAWLNPIAERAEEISEGYDEEEMLKELDAFEACFSNYDRLMRNYLASEYFADLFLPEFQLEDMVVAMQWISMEYAATKQACFLNWLISDTKQIPYEKVRDIMVIIARMMGYDDTDIREYMENSFEETVWDWGYLALICGR